MRSTAVILFVLSLWGAHASAASASVSDVFKGITYRGIGPAIAGGRTTGVAGSDVDPNIYYAGGAGGGVFKTTDGGASWRPVFDSQPVAPIGAIAVAANNPNDVWVGTGEANPRNEVERGDGIWHSVDGGKTWAHLGLSDAGSISAISIDPRNPQHVAVAVLGQIFRDSQTRGVYTSFDRGAHWTRALYVGSSVGASDLVRSPDDPDTLYAGMYFLRRQPWTMTSGGPGGGVFRSHDGGLSWQKLIGHGLPTGLTGRIGLAAASRGRVYAIIQAAGGELWRSDDAGQNWNVMPHSYLVGDRRFYFNRIFVDPANRDRLIAVGLELAMSTNGGYSFKMTAPNAGWDYHVAWWSKDGRRIALGCDEGFVLSTSGGEHWWQPYDLPFAQAYHVGFDDAQPNYHVCIGLQDASVWCGAANSDSGLGVLNRDWMQTGGGDGMWALYDPVDPHLLWSTSTATGSGQVYLFDFRTQQAAEVSPDVEMSDLLAAKNLRYRFNWDSPIAFTQDGKALVGGNVVFESGDHGQHWTIISPDLTRNERTHQGVPGGPIDADMSGAEVSDTLLALATSKLEPGLIWAGTDDGLIQITRDGGMHWRNVTPPQMPAWGRVATIDAGNAAPGTAFAAVDHHMSGDDRPYIFETTNYGATWSSIAGNLPTDFFVRVVRQDLHNPKVLYVGTQRGVFASWDGGAHWRSLRLNMPATAIYDIELQPRTNDLIVASHGRGVWILDDLTPVQDFSSLAQRSPQLLPVRDTYRWWQWQPIFAFYQNALPDNIFAGPNLDYGALISYWLPHTTATKASRPMIEVLNEQRKVIRHLKPSSISHKEGFNRTSWDLQEDGPEKWLGTFKENQGPSEGAEVVPGTYTIRLTYGKTTQEQRVVVKGDPRSGDTLESYQRRHDFLSAIYGELGSVDHMLNRIDRLLKHASGGETRALLALQARLTHVPRSDEDASGPARLRQRLMDLIDRLTTTSYQAPTAADLAEAARVKRLFDQVRASSEPLLKQ